MNEPGHRYFFPISKEMPWKRGQDARKTSEELETIRGIEEEGSIKGIRRKNNKRTEKAEEKG